LPSALPSSELETNPRFRQTLAGDAVENRQAQEISKAIFDVDSQPATPAMAYRIMPSFARKRSFGKKVGSTPSSIR
jgi:hypothetical protein